MYQKKKKILYNESRSFILKIFNKIKQRGNICKVNSVLITKLFLEPSEILLGDSISIDSLCEE